MLTYQFLICIVIPTIRCLYVYLMHSGVEALGIFATVRWLRKTNHVIAP